MKTKSILSKKDVILCINTIYDRMETISHLTPIYMAKKENNKLKKLITKLNKYEKTLA